MPWEPWVVAERTFDVMNEAAGSPFEGGGPGLREQGVMREAEVGRIRHEAMELKQEADKSRIKGNSPDKGGGVCRAPLL